MQTPPPLPSALVQAQQHEGSPEVATRDYEALYQRCQSGSAAELMAAKDDCGTVAFRLGQSLERAERYAEAAQIFLSLRTLSQDRVKIARAQVRAALLQADHLGAPGEALQLCRQVIAAVPAEIPAEDALRLLVTLRTESPAPRREPAAVLPAAAKGEGTSSAPRAPAAAGELAAELDQLAETLRPHETIASFALLYGAQAAERREQPAEALRRYDEIWRRYPRGPLFDDALWMAAQLLQRLGRSAEAAERLSRLAQAYTSTVMIGHYHQERLIEGMFRLGELYLRELDRPQQALETLTQLLSRQPESRLADDALLLMAQATLRLGPLPAANRSKACAYLMRLLRDYPDSNRRRAALALHKEQGCP